MLPPTTHVTGYFTQLGSFLKSMLKNYKSRILGPKIKRSISAGPYKNAMIFFSISVKKLDKNILKEFIEDNNPFLMINLFRVFIWTLS